MAIPTYEDLMLPLLQSTRDGVDYALSDLIVSLAQKFTLSAEDIAELLPSGKQPRFANRVGWARTALKKAGLLESPRRGIVHITQRGLDVLSEGPAQITDKYLLRFPDYLEYKGVVSAAVAAPDASLSSGSHQDPRERLESAYIELRTAAAQDILAKVKSCTPEFFENLVVELLVKMGYGGSPRDAGQAVGKSGDGGVDGIIKEDELGLDMIYLQAKRYEAANVPIGAVRDFVGALVGKRARKGVLITTSGFGDEAKKFVHTIEGKTLVLIDGVMLANLMLRHRVGFSVTQTYEIGGIDESYFEEN